MSKRVPLSRATKELQALLPKIRRSESEIADAYADVSRAETRAALAASMPPSALLLDEAQGFDETPFGLEYVWMARWAACKHVYRIDAEVAEALKSQPLEGALPADALRRLAYPIVYIDCPVDVSVGDYDKATTLPAAGFLAYTGTSVENGAPTLNIVYMYKEPDEFGRRRALVELDLSSATLGECVSQVVGADMDFWERAGVQDVAKARADAEAETFAACISQVLNLLLYTVSADQDAEVVYSPPKASRGQKAGKRTNPESIELLGARIGRAIGEARRVSLQDGQAPARAGSKKSPHIRRAHWQSFWTGPRKNRADGRPGDKLVVRWIPPIEVNGSAAAPEIVHNDRAR